MDRLDLEALAFEVLGHQLAELGIVVDDQYRHFDPILSARDVS
jgi:hypothetical protein